MEKKKLEEEIPELGDIATEIKELGSHLKEFSCLQLRVIGQKSCRNKF